MVGAIKQLQASDRLQGGIFNNESIFQPVYQMLLALHTAAFCCLLARVKLPPILPLYQQAAEELSEGSLHPVLAAMLANTMAVWSASEADIIRMVSLAHPHVFYWIKANPQMDDCSSCILMCVWLASKVPNGCT